MTSSLPVALPSEFSLAVGLGTWLVMLVWTWLRGWRIHRHYVVSVGKVAVGRTALTWTVALVGVIVLVAAHARPGLPGIVVVAMVGLNAAWVDVRTHRLPTRFTLLMALGVALGLGCALLVGGVEPLHRLVTTALGAALWGIVLWAGRFVGAGVGGGDVRLAPVLGAMLGIVGLEAAVTGLALALLGAATAALWALISGAGSSRTRMAMGQWLVAGAVLGHVLWGVLPDWFS